MDKQLSQRNFGRLALTLLAIGFALLADGFRLAVEDDGCGITEGASPRGTGLGSRLISAMAHNLASTIEYDSDHPGCRAVLVASV